MNLNILTTISRQILPSCAICAMVGLLSFSANAQDVELDMKLLRAAFEAADSSGDGRIDEAELAADTVAAFVAADRNGDDRLSVKELRDSGGANIESLDADNNESLTIVEVMNAKIIEFQKADANGDGDLTIEEIIQFERSR